MRFSIAVATGIVSGSVVGYLGLIVLGFVMMDRPITPFEVIVYPFAASIPASVASLGAFCAHYFWRNVLDACNRLLFRATGWRVIIRNT